MNPWTPLIAATLGWGSSAVLQRAVLLNGVDTFDMLPMRMAFAMATLGLVILFTRRFGTTTALSWRYGLILGVAGMAAPMSLMTLSLEDLPVSLGGLLVALIPIATIASAHFLVEGERFQPRSLLGLLVSLAGSAVLVGIGGESIEGVDNLWRGVFFMVAGVALAGVGGALSRRFALQVKSETLVLPQFTVGTIVLFLLIPLLGEEGVSAFGPAEWVMVAAIGAIGTTVPFGSFLVAASMNPASRLGLVGYLVPVVGVTLAVVFLGETVTTSIMVGAVLILGGVFLAERGTKHVPEPGVTTAR